MSASKADRPGAKRRPSAEPAKRRRQRRQKRGDLQEEIRWSDMAVEQLHEALLEQSLKDLRTSGNAAHKRELLQWIFAPSALLAVLPDAKGAAVEAVLPQACTPFSFERCCRICGYDAQRLRSGLLPIVRDLGLSVDQSIGGS